jgi:protein O-GlcNAc transferase
MKRVISFALWGNNPTYNIGAIKNAELAQTFYPDFECWFYIHKESVPQETIDKLNLLANTKIIFKTGDLSKNKPMMWRFEAIDEPDVEIMLSRDTDTRFLLREKLAVEEWLKSNTLFHIMRDHPHHNFCILGGMFGTKKIPNLPSWTNIINNFCQVGNRDYDQVFLRDYIYPLIVNNSTIHASFNKKEHHAKNFPICYCNQLRFVGEYVYHNESRSIEHINILKISL